MLETIFRAIVDSLSTFEGFAVFAFVLIAGLVASR